jgi:DNA-binding transcriptional LysR family regulator
MQIESLKVFCDLVDTGSFTRSAVINGVTQSAVSQQISALERNFKTPLLDRNQGKGKVRLTRKGQVLYENSKKILAVYGSLIQQMDGSSADAVSTIRMTTTSVKFYQSRPLHGSEEDDDPDDLKI